MNSLWTRWWNKAARPKPSAARPLAVEPLESRENPAVVTAVVLPAGLFQSQSPIAVGGSFELTNQDAGVAHEYELRVVRDGQQLARVVGAVPAGSSGTVPPLNFTPAAGGAYSAVLVFSEPGLTSAYADNVNLVAVSRPFVVEPTVPVARILSGPTTSPEAGPVTFTARFDDPGQLGGTYTYSWLATSTNGDRHQLADQNSAAGDVRSFTFTPRDDGPYTVTIQARDAQGNVSNLATRSLRVTAAAPTNLVINANAGANPPVGVAIRGIAAFTDPAGAQDRPYTLTWTLNSTTGQTDTFSGQVQDGNSSAGAATYVFTPRAAGIFSLTLAVADKDGATSRVTRTFTVGQQTPQVAPSVVVSNPGNAGVTNSALTLTGSFTDPAGSQDAPYVATWTFQRAGGAAETRTQTVNASENLSQQLFTPTVAGTYTRHAAGSPTAPACRAARPRRSPSPRRRPRPCRRSCNCK